MNVDRGPLQMRGAKPEQDWQSMRTVITVLSPDQIGPRWLLVAGSGKVDRPALRSIEEAEALLNDCLTGFFSDLADSKSPRLAVRITMGIGKTTKGIQHLKQYLASKHGQNIEVYVPRHDLADEWEQGLDGINARVVWG